MPTSDVKTAAARNAQSAADKQDLRDRLLGKKRRSKDVDIFVDGDKITLHMEALSAAELDTLRAKHKPTAAQRLDGFSVNTDTFNPALVAAVTDGVSETDVKAMYKSGSWSQGELATLFNAASELCLEGMDIPFNATA